MEPEKARAPHDGDGCLVGVVRIPVKIVAVLVVLPVRVVWDLLVAGARALYRTVLGPVWERVLLPSLRGLGRLVGLLLKTLLYWPWVGLWRYVLVPAGQGVAWLLAVLVVRPSVWLWHHVLVPLWQHALAPAGRAFALVLAGAVRYLLVLPAQLLFRYVLAPLGHALHWLAMALFVWPWAALWRYVVVPGAVGAYRHVLAPLGRGTYAYLLLPLGRLLVAAWHLAGYVSRALGRGVVWAWRLLVVRPAAWVRRYLVAPVAHAVRLAARSVHRQVLAPVGNVVREMWRTSRLAVREARAEVRRALFGGPGREPSRSRARTLGSNTAVGDPPAAPEISLRQQG